MRNLVLPALWSPLLCSFVAIFQSGFTDGTGTGSGIQQIIGAIPIIGGIISGILSLFGVGNALADAVKSLANFTVTGLSWAGVASSNIYGFLRNTLSYGVSIFHWLWDNVIKNVLSKVVQAIAKAHAWLEEHLRPVIDFIKKVRTWYDRMFKIYIKPFLNMLQHIRQVLGILRALHIGWAAALDRRLLQIESYVSGLFNQVRSILNGVIDILNSIADPMSIIRKPTIVLSTRRTINSIIRVGTGRPPGFFFPSPRRGVSTGLGFLPSNFVASDPSMNPPASNYLGGNDGLPGFNGFLPGQIPDNTAVDDAEPLDYFNDDLYPPPDCSDAADCARQAMQDLLANPIVAK